MDKIGIIGHQKQWEFLKKTADSGKVSHAYLFYGPSQIGKKRVAIEFAKYLNCQRRDIKNQACQVCQTCYQIEAGVHPDLVFVSPAEGKSSIAIEQIRELKTRISFSPLDNGYKIAMIDQAHLMTHDAQSALLKQLEEPKGRTVIILISEYSHNLLPTVLSRCQGLRFCLVPPSLIKKEFSKEDVKKEGFDTDLVALGKPGIIFNYLLSPELGLEREQRVKEIAELKEEDFYHRFRYAEKLSKQNDINEVLEIWLNYFRGLMQKILEDHQEAHLSSWNLSDIRKIIHSIQNLQRLISSTNINTRLALELFLMEI